jgi:hypothetical protein
VSRDAEKVKLQRVARCARAIVEHIDKDTLYRVHEMRSAFPGAGGQHFITNARLDNLVQALRDLDAT